jgi:DNA-binding transcriptional LysR family regulator
MREGHPDARSNALSLERFCALNHALVSFTGERFWGVTDEALAKVGRQRHIALSVTSFLILVEILHTTDMIAVAPRRLMASAQGLQLFPPPVEVPGFTKVAAWHERTHRNHAHQWIRQLLFDLWPATA